jgi:hypothetical protein
MKNFAWINTETEYVENIINYDGVTPIQLPENIILIEIPEEGIAGEWSMLTNDWKYINGQFVEPPQPTITGSQTP